MAQKLSLSDLPINGKRVLMRVDFNVPLDPSGQITDDSRIVASLPSIRYVLQHQASLILMSHLGRPKGKNSSLSLKPVAERLAKLLGQPVTLVSDAVGSEAEGLAKRLQPGQVLLLENLRFHKGEESPTEEPAFAESLARLGDVYVNDAFGSSHRDHTSVTRVPRFFQGKAAAGFLLQKELEFLGDALKEPKRPFVAVIGGAKISTKIGVLEALVKKADTLLIGGGMAFTFYKAQGIPIGKSIHEEDCIPQAKRLLEATKKGRCKIFLPLDVVIASEAKAGVVSDIIPVQNGIPENLEGVDIGPKTIELFSHELQKAGTVLWNGPLGVFEVPQFAVGTESIAQCIAGLKALKIVGGGDSIAAIHAAGVADRIDHLSTGGGASLEFVEYGTLPGVECLSDVPTAVKA